MRKLQYDISPSPSTQTNPVERRILLRAHEVAEILGISRMMAYRLMANGTLPICRISGTTVRVSRLALLQWIAAHSAETAETVEPVAPRIVATAADGPPRIVATKAGLRF